MIKGDEMSENPSTEHSLCSKKISVNTLWVMIVKAFIKGVLLANYLISADSSTMREAE